VCGVLTGLRDELLFERFKLIDVFKMTVSSVPNCVQNLFCSTSTLVEQPLLLYIIVTVVCSECDIFVCSVCTGNWCIFMLFVMCANTDITSFYVIPVDSHKVVSVCCTVHVEKSHCMQQLMYNYPVAHASVALEVQLLAL